MRIAALVALLVVSLCVRAQDVHFSQFHVAPLLQNPANTGYFNCDYRFTAIYRSQWNSITVPYKTFTGSYDMRFIRKKSSGREIKTTKDIMGLGVLLLSDKAGDGGFKRQNFGLSGAFHKRLDRYGRNYFGGGVMASYGSVSIDFSKLQWEDQYLFPGGFQPTKETPFSSFNYFDLAAGIEYNHISPNRQQHYQLGGAMYHVTRPRQTFLGDRSSRLPVRYVVHGSAQFTVSQKLEIYPKLNFMYQRTSYELLIGSFARLDVKQTRTKDYGVYIGAWVRVKDAVIAVTRFDINKFSFAFSYDINVSSLRTVSEARGGPEFSLIYIGCLPKKPSKGVFCPRF